METVPLDQFLIPRFEGLDSKQWEDLCLAFLRSGPRLTISRHGRAVTRRVIEALPYAAKSGMKQDGIDIRAKMEGGEEWAFQCKRVEKFGKTGLTKVLEAAKGYSAQHFFLVLTCEPTKPACDEIKKHPKWTMWGPTVFCDELRRLPSGELKSLLSPVLSAADIRRIAPLASGAFVSSEAFFDRQLGDDKAFRHDWKLVGRRDDLAVIAKFTDKADKAALVITSKGGDGKSRLLLAASEAFQERHPDGQVIFYNHKRDPVHDPVEEGLSNLRQPTLLLIDDAHRVDDLPPNLLDAAASTQGLKIILAARPQGLAELMRRIRTAGIDEARIEQWKLQPLPKFRMRELAQQALAGVSAPSPEELLLFTRDSAFLTTLAGAMLQKGLLKWRNWRSPSHFLSRVLECYKDNNLQSLPADERHHAELLLRLIAILAPVQIGTPDTRNWFLSHAAKIMEQSEDRVDEWHRFLKRADLVIEGSKGGRVVPGLFADFIVFDSAYGLDGSGPRPFVQRLLKDEEMRSPVMIRNLAEASWLLGEGEKAAETLLKPVVENEKRHFLKRSFWKRARQIEAWHHFGIYLPGASLDLCRLAMDEKEAPTDPDGNSVWYAKSLDTRTFLLEKLPPLLRDIARHHAEHQPRALDMLWELSLTVEPDWVRHYGSERPLEALAKVFTVELDTPPNAAMSAIHWLRNKVQQPHVLEQIASHSILSAVCSPCFHWEQSRSYSEGSLFTHEKSVSLANSTLDSRNEALAVLRHVIEHGDWRCACRAITSLSSAIRGLTEPEAGLIKPDHRQKILGIVTEEMLKGLALVELALQRHSHLLVRVTADRLLAEKLYFWKDLGFRKECERVMSTIERGSDFDVALALISDGYLEEPAGDDEDEKADAASHLEQAERRWRAKAQAAASGLVKRIPEASGQAQYLGDLVTSLAEHEFHPVPTRLLQVLAESAPVAARNLAVWLVKNPEHVLASGWTALIGSHNPDLTDMNRQEFLLRALQAPPSAARLDALDEVMRQARNQPLSASVRKSMETVAPCFTWQESHRFLDRLNVIHQENLEWAWSTLGKLPSHLVQPELARKLLEILSWHSSDRTPELAKAVQAALQRLDQIEDIPIHNREYGLLRLCQSHPREVFDFLCRRLKIAESVVVANMDYSPIPSADFWGGLSFGDLSAEPDFIDLAERLWQKVRQQHACWRVYRGWKTLFQAVVLPHQEVWKERWLESVRKAESLDDLLRVACLVSFDGSLLFFNQPELARAVLTKAEELAGHEGTVRSQEFLYSFYVSTSRSYTGGTLDARYRYLEAAALEAAKASENDPVLGPFYRWIVKCEQEDRRRSLADHQASMAVLEAEDE